jgi:3-deoxy-D-manno-octulosonic-acid transferase
MSSLLFDIAYASALVATSPIWVYRMLRHGRYRRGMGQRLGAVPVRYGLQPTIWVGGVSVGEIKAAQPLIRELHSQLPDFRIVVCSWTDTGLDEARRLFDPDYLVFARPLDLSFAVSRALDRMRPSLVVLIEGDIWPNFLRACNRRDIPVVVVNGRMSQNKGYPRYKKLGSLSGKLFNRLTAIGVQDETYADRFRSLGTDPQKLHVTGMMKFDRPVESAVPGQEALADAMGIAAGDPLIVAGGTGDGEEQIVLDAFREIRKANGRAKLAIVPRKPERFDEVARTIAAAGFSVLRRTERPDGATGATDPSAVILGDTMGELRKFYALASCIFVGRSLVAMGGSDMIEAAALGKPTAFGPHTFNFPQADDLVQHGCVRVADGEELRATLGTWLADPAHATAAGKEAQDFIRSQQGATRRNVEMICGVLGRVAAAAPGAIATDQIQQKG